MRASANSTPEKLAFFDQVFPNANFSIAAFVETHHANEDDIPDEIKQYTTTHHLLHTPTPSTETHSGIIVLVSKEYEIKNKTDIIPGRLLNITLVHQATKMEHNLSVFYGYARWNNMRNDEITSVLEHFHRAHKIENNNLILGDFNFADNEADKGKGKGTRDRKTSTLWEFFKTQTDIVDPFRIQYPRKRTYSYVTSTGKSRGDRVYISNDNIKNLTNFGYIDTPFNSAHKIMLFDLKVYQDLGPGYWKMNCSVLKDTAYIQEIEEAIQGINDLNITNPIDWWDLFIIVIQGVTKSYTKRKANIQKSLKRHIVAQLRQLESLNYDDMTVTQKERYLYYKQQHKDIVYREIQGHQIRTKGHPTYEINEPDIEFYAKLEKRSVQRNMITELQDKNGQTQTENEKLIEIVEDYYTKLYTPSRVDIIKQQQLLRNVDKTISARDKQFLDAPITAQELEQTVRQLHDNKSPGYDGINAEFYKAFWYLIKDKYLEYINAAKLTSFSDYRNTSITTIIYKFKGELYILANYRPISLINVDIKILTATLKNRLKNVLPTIIHHSQTAVVGRKIDHTVHMLRDLIDLVDKEDSQGAFLFIDQEKAFDRVNHDFLYKTMETFGIGQSFIDWVKIIYSNATTKVKINGHLTANIPLKRGVRQGCPLSSLLYVLVIEILALALRKNKNIVGFQVEGEKIISLHYADDAVITIKQNQCFKEVIKDLKDYEEASGAKINYEKTKGLWVGKWKNRQDKPIDIEWTNENVKTLGVYFGNNNPAEQTFEEIVPKIKRSMNYWKQFRLSVFAKARVIEIFHASRLWYAATFYNIPPNIAKDLQKAFFDYINFPHTSATVSQQEMQKLRKDGGAKLIDIKTKTDTSKVVWLMEIVTNPELNMHKNIITALLGTQKGNLKGIDLFFTTNHYAKKIFKTENAFYKDAIHTITQLPTKKKIEDAKLENVFYNTTFTDSEMNTIPINPSCQKNNIYTYGQILVEHEKRQNQQPHNRHIANIYLKITNKDLENRTENVIYHTESKTYVKFQDTENKQIYQELIKLQYKEHHSKNKWEERFPETTLDWDNIWKSINNPITLEDTKTAIWQQIHLNDYTTYSYNKWKKVQQACPLCTQIPTNRFHITLDCPIVVKLWEDLEPHLKNIYPNNITEREKVFGIQGNTPNIILRNWLTFLLRQIIYEQERTAFYNKKGTRNEIDIKLRYNQTVKTEVWKKEQLYSNLGKSDYFKRIFAANDYLIEWRNEQWQILTLYNIS